MSLNRTEDASLFPTLVRQTGLKNTTDYRVFVENKNGKVISPFHDIPLYADEAKGTFNMVCEVPRFSNAKLEISKDELMNPIKQDVKKGALRFVKNCFPYHGYLWNYGALPQTWESPEEVDPDTGCRGDNDPIDAIEIGGAIATVGQVKQVKVLGVLGMIDEGETDWKLVVIDVNDEMASVLNDIQDVEEKCPGLLDASRDWFRIYKVPDGKPFNNFAFDGAYKDRAYALKTIASTHHSWKELIAGKVPKKTEKYNIEVTNQLGSDKSPYSSDYESIVSRLPLPHSNKSSEHLHAVSESVGSWSFVARSN